jgi:hypothetical protein
VRSRFAYLHIPKVAGSSVSRALADANPQARRAPFLLDRILFGGFDRFDEVEPANAASVWEPGAAALADFDVAVGHFGLDSLLTGFAPGDVATIVREPRTRLLSHYSFWRGWDDQVHDGWAPYAASRVAATSDWYDFLLEPSIAAQTDNLCVRMLIGADPAVPLDGFIEGDDLDALTNRAIASLDNLGYVDLIERGDECWSGLGEWLGTELVVPRVNVTQLASGPRIDRAWFGDGGALSDRTRGDRRLWDHIAERFEVDPSVADTVWAAQIERVCGSFDAQPGSSDRAVSPEESPDRTARGLVRSFAARLTAGRR